MYVCNIDVAQFYTIGSFYTKLFEFILQFHSLKELNFTCFSHTKTNVFILSEVNLTMKRLQLLATAVLQVKHSLFSEYLLIFTYTNYEYYTFYCIQCQLIYKSFLAFYTGGTANASVLSWNGEHGNITFRNSG